MTAYLILGGCGWLQPWGLLAGTVGITGFSIWVGHRAVRQDGVKDPSWFVLDEVAGYLTSCLFLESYGYFRVAIFGFILFRLFDIMKPLMIRRIEALPGGFGIVLDDIAAGLLANAILQVVLPRTIHA